MWGLDAIVFDLAAFNFNLFTFFHKAIDHSSLFSTDCEDTSDYSSYDSSWLDVFLLSNNLSNLYN